MPSVQLSKEKGIYTRTIVSWENGKSEMSFKIAVKLVEYFGVILERLAVTIY